MYQPLAYSTINTPSITGDSTLFYLFFMRIGILSHKYNSSRRTAYALCETKGPIKRKKNWCAGETGRVALLSHSGCRYHFPHTARWVEVCPWVKGSEVKAKYCSVFPPNISCLASSRTVSDTIYRAAGWGATALCRCLCLWNHYHHYAWCTGSDILIDYCMFDQTERWITKGPVCVQLMAISSCVLGVQGVCQSRSP